jgi:antitoxin component of RelBE/YafQ-DinJ toxin-antitoxin module
MAAVVEKKKHESIKRHNFDSNKSANDKPTNGKSVNASVGRCTSTQRIVNARTDARTADAAAEIAQRQGLTLSLVIRNTLGYIAQTGTIPQSALPQNEKKQSTDMLRDFCKGLKAASMPGKKDFAGLSDAEMVERIRMERYGY